MLAKHFGEAGGPEASSYLTPDGETFPTPVCGLRQCYIAIHGAYDFHLDAQRRVEGANGSNRPPGAPTNVHTISGYNRVRLFWNAPVDTGGSPITGYLVEQTPPGDVIGGTNPVIFAVDAGSAPGAVIDGLTNFQSYKFRVRAMTIIGNGPWSDYSPFATPGPTTPEPPLLDTATGDPATNGRINATWSLPPDFGDGGSPLTGYRLTANDPSSTPTVVTYNNPATFSGAVTGLEDNTRYSVLVSALNSYGEGSPSASIAGVLTLPGKPGTPTAASSGTAGTVVLTFTPPSAGQFADFTNFRAKVGSTNSSPVDAATASATTTSCKLTVSGVSVSSSTTVSVQAQNATGWGPLSDSLTIPPDTTPPTLAVTFPTNPAYGTAAWNAGCGGAGGAVCGTASDAAPGAVSSVTLTIRRSSDNRYWNGNPGTTTSQWSTSTQNLTATGTTSWSRALTTASLENTVSYTVTATAKDSLNQTSSVTRTFAYVTGQPTAALTAPANSAFVGGVVTVSGNAGATSPASVASADFQYKPSAGSTWTSIALDTTSPYSTPWDTSALTDGAYDLRMITSDTAGNTTTSSTRSVTVDNVAPTGTITAPAAASTVGGTVTVSSDSADSGSGVANATFQSSPTGAGTWTTIGTDSSSPYSVSWNTAALAQGAYDLRVITTDNAGKTFTSPSVVVFVDSAPTASITFPADNAKYNTTGWTAGCSSPGICGTAADTAPGTIASVKVTIQRSSDGRYWNGTAGTSTSQWLSAAQNLTATGTTSWFKTMTTGSLSTGVTYTVVATVTDNAGLTGTDSHSFLYETVAPTGSITAPANGANLRGSVTVSSNSADTGGAGVAAAVFEYSVLSTGPWTAIGTDTTSPYGVAWDTTGVPDNQYYLRVTTTDGAGNSFSSVATAVQVRVDNTAPTGSLTAPANGAFVKGSAVVVSSNSDDGTGSGVANATFQYKPAAGSTWTTIGAPDTSSPYFVNWNTTSGVPDGSYNLRVVTTDNVGNSFTSPTFTVIVDNQGPTIVGTATGTVGDNGWYRSNVDLSWSVTDSSGIQTSTGCGAQTISADTTGTPYTCSATDNAGNSNNGTVTIKLDKTPPTGSLTGPADGSYVSGTIGVFSNSADPTSGVADAKFQRRPSGSGSWTEIGTDTSSPYSVSWNTSSLSEGSYDLRVVTTDNAGNLFNSATRTVTVDRQGPTIVGTATGTVGDNGWYRSNVDLSWSVTDSSGIQTSTGCGAQTISADTTGTPYTCSATDNAGNSNNGTVTIKLDKTPPTGSLTGPADGAFVSGTIGVFSNSNDTTSGVSAAKFERRPAGSGGWTTIGTDSSSPYSVSWNTSGLSGSYDLRVTTTDNAGNTFTSPTRTVTVDTTDPEPTDVTLHNGPGNTAGKAEEDDYFTITFSEALDVSTLCSEWSGSSSNQSSNNVTVTFDNSGSSDEVKFLTKCSNIGIVDTNRNYVSSDTSFTSSTVAWNVASRTLTVTLGSPSRSTRSGQGNRAPTYRPTSGMTDLAGNPMDTSSFTGTNSRF